MPFWKAAGFKFLLYFCPGRHSGLEQAKSQKVKEIKKHASRNLRDMHVEF